jgi:hypothetical protein
VRLARPTFSRYLVKHGTSGWRTFWSESTPSGDPAVLRLGAAA